jgi:hypothetical protein
VGARVFLVLNADGRCWLLVSVAMDLRVAKEGVLDREVGITGG